MDEYSDLSSFEDFTWSNTEVIEEGEPVFFDITSDPLIAGMKC
jgi:hypothetical protein